jgi:beta-lactamase regulating signal transducer with metallopeptidase domain
METVDRYLLTFLVNALWQIPIAAGVAAATCRFMRNAPARHRHTVCVTALVAAVLLPVAGLRSSGPQRQALAVPQRLEVAVGPEVAALPRPTQAPPQRSLPLPRATASIALYALGAWLLYRAAALLWAAARTIRICRAATPTERSFPIWERCRNTFGLGHAELRWSARTDGPVAAGRMVILPENMAGAPDEILATAIGHESAHLARRDFAANILCELIALPISFHPATVWLRREIGRTREMACDELVTSRLLAPDVYARSIVSIAGSLSGFRPAGYSLGVLDGDILEERIRRLLEGRVANLKRARLMLAAGLATLAVLVAIGSGLAISARAQTPAQQEMRSAADAYNSGQFAEAAERFEKAVSLDPANLNARLFLANTYLRQHVDEHKAIGDRDAHLQVKAREQYEEVLRRDPKNETAAFALVTLDGAKHLERSRALMLDIAKDNPKNTEAYYTLGVLDWAATFPIVSKANGGAGPRMYDQIANPAARAGVRSQVLPSIEEGFRVLQGAISIDPGWSDPMAYMNLLCRLKAAVVDDPAESMHLIAQADDWVGKAIQARRERPSSTASDRIDVDAPPTAPVPKLIPAPPPPPPPPPGGFRGSGDKQVPPPPPPPPR